MPDAPRNVFVFPGAGGHGPLLDTFRVDETDPTRFYTLRYPGWRRYEAPGYTASTLVDEFVAEIQSQVPEGPIWLVGLSIGGHFAYAAAHELQALGREVAGFCAIDTFMMASAAPTPGWKKRAAADAFRLLKTADLPALSEFVRSRLWRAALRVGDGRWLGRLTSSTQSSTRPNVLRDPMIEFERNLRRLIQMASPFVVALDQHPRPLNVPAILLRTEYTSKDDQAWRARCPSINIVGLPGDHLWLLTEAGTKIVRSAYLSAIEAWRRPIATAETTTPAGSSASA